MYRKLGEKLAQREQRNLWERKRLGRSVDLIDLLENSPVELLGGLKNYQEAQGQPKIKAITSVSPKTETKKGNIIDYWMFNCE